MAGVGKVGISRSGGRWVGGMAFNRVSFRVEDFKRVIFRDYPPSVSLHHN